MRPRTERKKRASLRGWWKGLPLLVMPFSLIFGEAWLRTQILNNDYEVNALNQRIRTLEGRLKSLRDEQVHLVRMERITAEAPDLGLVEPDPGQIVMLVAGEGGQDQALDAAAPEKLPVTQAPPILAQHLELLPEAQTAALAIAEPDEPLAAGAPLLEVLDPDVLLSEPYAE
ncbi:MAG: hypothetical protein WD873_05185 [Candidatus Hydrogenedentales bacterium]